MRHVRKSRDERVVGATSPGLGMKLSIVTTLYNSSSTVDEFCRRAVKAAEAVTQDFEIVLVDDGSPDDSLNIACHLAKEDSRVRVVELSRTSVTTRR